MAAPEQDKAPREHHAGSARAVETCYALMAVVTVIATGVGFWLSYAGLHAFDSAAGLKGPEAWAWPSSVDLFILAGELGITISTLRDGRTDWRAWVYFGAGCGPSITFNVLHAFPHVPEWAKYAVAATPPVAAVLALAALLQLVISLPDALRHMHSRQQQDEAATVQGSAEDEAEPASGTPAHAAPEQAAGPPPGQAPELPSSQAPEAAPEQPQAVVQVSRQGRSRRKVQGSPRRVSDADLKDELRLLLAGDPDLSAAAAARELKRNRDRVGRLLAEVRSGQATEPLAAAAR